MMQSIVNPLLIAFTLSTTVGVLVHDTQLDKAATLAVALPSAFAAAAAVDFAVKSDASHTHVERASAPKHAPGFRATTPRIQPRDDDHRYFLNKGGYMGGFDATRLWPSV